MSDLFINKGEDLLKMSKRDTLKFLIEEAKCKNEDVQWLLTKPKRDTLEFLASRLIGYPVELDYELLLSRLPTPQEYTNILIQDTEILTLIQNTVEQKLPTKDEVSEDLITKLTENEAFTSSLQTTIKQTINTQIAMSMEQNVLEIDITKNKIDMELIQKSISMELTKDE